MKKKIITGLSIFALALSTTMFSGCAELNFNAKVAEKETSGKYFTCIEKWNNYEIVFANDTNVMYLIYTNSYSFSITPLYNADGTLQIYGEGE